MTATADAHRDQMTADPVKGLNLALAFLLELALLGAIAYSASTLDAPTGVRWLVGIAAPVGLAAIWSVIAAPTAKRRLRRVPLALFKVTVFTLGALALYAAGEHALALALEAVALINLALSAVRNQ